MNVEGRGGGVGLYSRHDRKHDHPYIAGKSDKGRVWHDCSTSFSSASNIAATTIRSRNALSAAAVQRGQDAFSAKQLDKRPSRKQRPSRIWSFGARSAADVHGAHCRWAQCHPNTRPRTPHTHLRTCVTMGDVSRSCKTHSRPETTLKHCDAPGCTTSSTGLVRISKRV